MAISLRGAFLANHELSPAEERSLWKLLGFPWCSPGRLGRWLRSSPDSSPESPPRSSSASWFIEALQTPPCWISFFVIGWSPKAWCGKSRGEAGCFGSNISEPLIRTGSWYRHASKTGLGEEQVREIDFFARRVSPVCSCSVAVHLFSWRVTESHEPGSPRGL